MDEKRREAILLNKEVYEDIQASAEIPKHLKLHAWNFHLLVVINADGLAFTREEKEYIMGKRETLSGL